MVFVDTFIINEKIDLSSPEGIRLTATPLWIKWTDNVFYRVKCWYLRVLLRSLTYRHR